MRKKLLTNRHGFGNFKEVEVLNNEVARAGYDNPSGLYIVKFQDTVTEEIIYAVRGTNGGSDLAPDAAFITGGFHPQFSEALDFIQYDMFVNNISAENASVVGHSLGGGIAQIVSNTFGLAGTTYDPAAASQVIDGEGYNTWVNENLGQGFVVSGPPANFNNYIESGSLVSSGTDILADHVGTNNIVNFESNVGNYIALALALLGNKQLEHIKLERKSMLTSCTKEK